MLRKLAENQRKRDQLTIHAPVSGRVVAFRYEANKGPDDGKTLLKKSGSVLEAENRDCQLHRGDPICYVGNPQRMRGFMAIDQQDIELIELGQPVKIAIPYAGDVCVGQVCEISIEKNETGGEHPLPPKSRWANSVSEPVTYRVEFEFDADPRIRVGSVQRAPLLLVNRQTLLNFYPAGYAIRSGFDDAEITRRVPN